jgi:uncharacterized short protein YbdD (DUF466 family)
LNSHDYVAELHAKSHGKRFKTFKEWKGEGYSQIVQDMIGYANYVDKQRKKNPNPDSDSAPAPVMFETGPGKLLLLPPEAKGVKGIEIAKNAQEIICAYFLRHYCKILHIKLATTVVTVLFAELATGCNTVRTPWAVIGEDPSKFFDPSCLPPGFKFQDPSRMGISVKALLSHLQERQKDLGVNAFQFHHILRNNELTDAGYPTESRAAMAEEKPEVETADNDTLLDLPPATPIATPSKKRVGKPKSPVKPRKTKPKKEQSVTELDDHVLETTPGGNGTKAPGANLLNPVIPTEPIPPEYVPSIDSIAPIAPMTPVEVGSGMLSFPTDLRMLIPVDSTNPMSIVSASWTKTMAPPFPDTISHGFCPPNLLPHYSDFMAYISRQRESANGPDIGSHLAHGNLNPADETHGFMTM